MTPKKKLIEVALPLKAINKASAREKSIRLGLPSTEAGKRVKARENARRNAGKATVATTD